MTQPEVGDDDCDVFVYLSKQPCGNAFSSARQTQTPSKNMLRLRSGWQHFSHVMSISQTKNKKKDGNTTKKSQNDGFWKIFVLKFKQGRLWSAFDSATGENPLFTFVTSSPHLLSSCHKEWIPEKAFPCRGVLLLAWVESVIDGLSNYLQEGHDFWHAQGRWPASIFRTWRVLLKKEGDLERILK